MSALAKKLNITDGIKIKHCRAEQEAGANRAFYDAVTARAVAPLNTLLEYALPLLKEGGVFAAYKGANAVEEAERAENAALLTGASLKEIIFYSLENPRDRALVVYEKTGETPARFPRKTTTRDASRFESNGRAKAQLRFPQNAPYSTSAAGQTSAKYADGKIFAVLFKNNFIQYFSVQNTTARNIRAVVFYRVYIKECCFDVFLSGILYWFRIGDNHLVARFADVPGILYAVHNPCVGFASSDCSWSVIPTTISNVTVYSTFSPTLYSYV